MENQLLQLDPNTIIADKYKIDSIISQGTFGTVWQGTSLETKKSVAVKNCSKWYLVFNECSTLSRVGDSPICPKFFSFDCHESQWLVAMSLEGIDMFTMLNGYPDLKFCYHNLLAYIVHSINALRRFHEMDLVHRNIKLDNFAIGMSPGKAPLVLIDLSLAEQFDRATKTFSLPAEKFKLVAQAPPEVLRGGNWTDGCDLFQLAFSILHAAGYAYHPEVEYESYEQHAWVHEYTFYNLEQKLAPEDQYLIPLLEIMYKESQKFPEFIDYNMIIAELAAFEGYDPNIEFDFSFDL